MRRRCTIAAPLVVGFVPFLERPRGIRMPADGRRAWVALSDEAPTEEGDGGPRPVSRDDSLLRRVRAGVQVIGDDSANAPPAHAMSRRGSVQNLPGDSVYGDSAQPAPPSRIVEAVAAGEIDVAIAWGALNVVIERRRADIDALLDRYGVPRVRRAGDAQ